MKSMFVACLAAAVAAQPTQQWRTTSTSATLPTFAMSHAKTAQPMQQWRTTTSATMQPMGSLESLSQFDKNVNDQQYLAPQSNEVASVANEFGNVISQTAGPNAYERSLAQLKFFDEDSIVESYLQGDLVLSKGPEDIQSHMKELFSSINVQSQTVKIVGVNEEDALAMMEVRIIGSVKKTGKPLDATWFFVMELDALTQKIKTLLIVNKDKKELHEAFQTKADERLEDLIMAFFKSTPEELKDPNSLVWSMMSDDIQVKVNMYPEIYSKTTWNGKQELIDHFEEVHRSNFVFMDKLPELIQEMEYKVLLSTDSDVWVKLTWPGLGEGMIKHYIFDAQGLLVVEEITMLADLKPWQIFPMPFALDNKAQAQQDYAKQKDTYGKTNTLNIGGDVEKLTQIGKVNIGKYSEDEFEIETQEPMKDLDTMWGSTWNKPKVDMVKQTMKQKMKDAMKATMWRTAEKEDMQMQMQMDEQEIAKEKDAMQMQMQMDEQEKEAMQMQMQMDDEMTKEQRKEKRQQLMMKLAALMVNRN